MSEVRALSVRQPYAWAIASGRKVVENRSQYTAFRGTLLIHAGGTWHAEGETDPTIAAAWGEEVERLGVGPAGYSGPIHPMRHPDFFPRGILATVRLVDCHAAQGGCCPPWGRHPDGPGILPARPVWHWVLADARRLYAPVPAKGRLGLWRPSPEVMAAVREGLNGARR